MLHSLSLSIRFKLNFKTFPGVVPTDSPSGAPAFGGRMFVTATNQHPPSANPSPVSDVRRIIFLEIREMMKIGQLIYIHLYSP